MFPQLGYEADGVACVCIYSTHTHIHLPSSSIGYNDSIVDGEGIVGQSGNVPCSNLNGLPERLGDGEVRGTGDFERLALFDPL